LYQGGTKTNTGPSSFLGPRRNCIARFYSNQNIGKAFTVLRFTNVATNAVVEEATINFDLIAFILQGQGVMYLLYPLSQALAIIAYVLLKMSKATGLKSFTPKI